MKNCDKFDEWTECEKRGCQGCFYDIDKIKQALNTNIIIEFQERDYGKNKYIIDNIKKLCKNEIEKANNGIYLFRDNVIMRKHYETSINCYQKILERIEMYEKI
jgi:hypothetical protein